jgi:hypothetical protein
MTISLLTVAGQVSSSLAFLFLTASAALQSALVRLSASAPPPPKIGPRPNRSPRVLDFLSRLLSWNTSSARGLDREADGLAGRLGKLILPLPDDRLRERVGYVHGGSRVKREERCSGGGGVEVKRGRKASSSSGRVFCVNPGWLGVPWPKVRGESSRCGPAGSGDWMDANGDVDVLGVDVCAGVWGSLAAEDDSMSGMGSGYDCGRRLERTDCECIEYDLEPEDEEMVPAGEPEWEGGVSFVEATVRTREGARVVDGVTGAEIRCVWRLDDLEWTELFDPELRRCSEPNSPT